MTALTGRDVARRALVAIERDRLFASAALSRTLESTSLAEADRRLATELIYGVLRHRSRLDRALDHYAHRGTAKLKLEFRTALRVAAYQILMLDRVPDHAAVDDAVGVIAARAGKRMAGFANGLLRRLAREGEPPLPDAGVSPVVAAAVATSTPSWIAERVAECHPGAIAAALEALNRPAPLALRVNTPRATAGEVEAELCEEFRACEVSRSELVREALLATGIGNPARSGSFRRGLWTVQDVGAQLVAHMLAPEPGQELLDACCGVGGKTTHLSQLVAGRARIDALDRSPANLECLTESVARLGAGGIRPLCVDLLDAAAVEDAIGDRQYDGVLVDAPCTGLGVMRRHPEAKWRITPDDVIRMAELQNQLLEVVHPRVRVGGTLVYSVCTFTEEEGAEVIGQFIASHPEFEIEAPLAREGDPPWQRVLDAGGCVRTWPHHVEADGFFAARLVRRH